MNERSSRAPEAARAEAIRRGGALDPLRWIAPSALALALAACGARSTLGASGGGDGGAAQATTGGSGPGGGGGTAQGGAGQGGAGPGSGGQGGAGAAGGGPPALCSTLTVLDPFIEPPAPPGRALKSPLLRALPDGRTLLLGRADAIESPGPVPSQVAAIAFDPFGAWPPAMPGPVIVYPTMTQTTFAASVEPMGTLAVLANRFPMNAPPGCSIDASFGVAPDKPPGPGAFLLPFNGTCDDAVIAVGTSGDGSRLVANDLNLGFAGFAQRGIVAHVLDAAGTPVYAPEPRCATTPIVGDVLPRDQGFLLAHATADDDDCGLVDDVPPGPARRLLVSRMSAMGEETQVVHQGNDDLVFVELLPRAEGAWLFFRESGASALVQPPLMAMKLSPKGEPGPAFEVTDASALQVVAASMGDGFAVAFVDAIDPSAPTVIVRAFSAEGAPLGATSFSTNDAWLTQDRIALVGSPDHHRLLAGWVGASPDTGSRTLLRRIDCAGSP